MINRRAFLGAAILGVGGALWAVEERALPGRSALNHALRLDGPAGTIPVDEPGFSRTGTFDSHYVPAPVGWTVSYPSAAPTRVPVVIALHGLGGNHSTAFDGGLHLDRFLSAHVHSGGMPFAVASVDGGNSSYWHKRADGTDTASMVIDEFVPLLAGLNLDTSRLATFGWSMGGYGSLLIASMLGADRVSTAVASSPAVWPTYEGVQANAFDSEEEFDSDTIFARLGALTDVALRIDCGTDDAFADNVRQLRGSLDPTPAGGLQAGGHREAYWTRMVPDQFAFIGASF